MGQLEVFKDKKGVAMIEDVLPLDDAKAAGVQVVCSWFTEGSVGELKLGLVHPTSYSAKCCIGDVDLALVDKAKKQYTFTDPGRRAELNIANELAQPSAAPAGAAGASAEEGPATRVRVQLSHFEEDGASLDLRLVVRAEASGRQRRRPVRSAYTAE